MTTKRVSASLFAALLLAGCTAKAPTTEKTEATKAEVPSALSGTSNLDACQSFASAQFAASRSAEFGSIELDAETAKDEAAPSSIGSQAVGASISGDAIWQGKTGAPRDVAFTCLLDPTQKPVYFGIQELGPRDVVKVCWDGFEAAQWGPLTDCLEAALKNEEATLAAELTKATAQAAQSLDKLSAEKTLAASNAQWAAYRDGECDRRMAAVAGRNHPDLGELTCRIELTQKRIADFQFDAE